jgi:hypothetical protein
MKKFTIYALIVIALVVSISTVYLSSPKIPEAEASWEDCLAGCLVIAVEVCDDCNDSHIRAVFAECVNNSC